MYTYVHIYLFIYTYTYIYLFLMKYVYYNFLNFKFFMKFYESEILYFSQNLTAKHFYSTFVYMVGLKFSLFSKSSRLIIFAHFNLLKIIHKTLPLDNKNET